MDEYIARFEQAFVVPLRHTSAGARATRRTVDGFVAIKNGVASGGCCIERCSGPKNMTQPLYGRVFGVYKLVLFVNRSAHLPGPGNELFGSKMFQAGEIRLSASRGKI